MMNLFSSTAMFRKFMKAEWRMLLLVSRRGADAGKTFLSFHFHCRRQSLKEGKNERIRKFDTGYNYYDLQHGPVLSNQLPPLFVESHQLFSVA